MLNMEKKGMSGQDEEVAVTFHNQNNLIPAKCNYVILTSSENFKTGRVLTEHVVLPSHFMDKEN